MKLIVDDVVVVVGVGGVVVGFLAFSSTTKYHLPSADDGKLRLRSAPG